MSLSSESALRARTSDPLLALALLLLKLAQEERDAFLQALLRLSDLLNQVRDPGDRVLITRYILIVAKPNAEIVREALSVAVAEPVKEALLTAAEQLQEEARVAERRRNLETILRVRFRELDESTQARLREASGDQLAAWLPRSATASSLAEVFAEA